MTTLVQIEQALLDLDGATFQRLCDAYLSRTGLNSWVSIGLATGRRKTRAGTPDTLDIAATGFTLVEVTTEGERLGGKLIRDVKKCLDETRSHIPRGKIRRIILCFTGHLPAPAAATLYDLVRPHGIELTLIGPHRLAQDLRFRFPSLGLEFLGLPIDTGQLLTPTEFVHAQDAAATQTDLDAAFYGRETELTAIAEALTRGDLVVLLGPSGAGKTRLALEAVRRANVSASPPTVFCLRSRGASVFADMQSALEPPGRYLLLVDDANRVDGLAGLLDIAGARRADRDVRVVLTVRDYAAEPVLAVLEGRTQPAVVRVTPFGHRHRQSARARLQHQE